MELDPVSGPNRVVVSQWMPLPLRIFLGAVGAFACIAVVWELGPALWPLSFLTLFFGFIVLGGISVGLCFLLGAIFGPEVTWMIEPGRLTIRATLRDAIDVQTYAACDLVSLEVKEHRDNDGPDTFDLIAITQDPIRQNLGRTADIARNVILFVSLPLLNQSKAHAGKHTLRSPNFTSLDRAQAAVKLFYS
jgi:hypothetical protein